MARIAANDRGAAERAGRCGQGLKNSCKEQGIAIADDGLDWGIEGGQRFNGMGEQRAAEQGRILLWDGPTRAKAFAGGDQHDGGGRMAVGRQQHREHVCHAPLHRGQ